MIRNGRVRRGDRRLIARHRREVSQYLAPPGVVRGWSESGLSHKIKYRLKESSLIRRSPSGDRWETTDRLWLYVISIAGDDETIGWRASGQQVFSEVPPKSYTNSITG